MQANAFQVNSMFIRTQWLRMDSANTIHVYQLKRITAIPDFTLPAQDQNYHIAHCAKELCYAATLLPIPHLLSLEHSYCCYQTKQRIHLHSAPSLLP